MGILDGLDPALLPGGHDLVTDDPGAVLTAGRAMFTQLTEAVADGVLGYVAITATT